MPSYKGSTGQSPIYNGYDLIDSIYKGEDLVYSSEPDPIPFIFSHTTSADATAVSLVVTPTSYDYDFDVEWGDDTVSTYTTASLSGLTSISHTYTTAGTYTVKIYRKWASLLFDTTWKINSITQWGNGWETLENLLAGVKLGTTSGGTIVYFELPVFPPNKKVLSASKMFNSKSSGTDKAFTIPDGFFKNLTKCVNFSECFCAVRDKSVTNTNYIKINGQPFPDGAGDLSACFAGCDLSAHDNKIPEDLLYNITGVTSLAHIFGTSNSYENNKTYVLPNRWFPKNLSNCLDFDNLFVLRTTYDSVTGSQTNGNTTDKITGTMENIWDRADINPNADIRFAMSNLGSVSNYEVGIPMSWGALLTETPTATSSSGAFDSTVVPGQTTVSLSTKSGYTTLYGLVDTGTGIANGVVKDISYYDTMSVYTEPILVPAGATYFTIHYAYKRNSDGKCSWVEWSNVNITSTETTT